MQKNFEAYHYAATNALLGIFFMSGYLQALTYS